ncbi:MAG TPA: YihY/virulence factor BrkB family protein [Elusimicrobiota bacterium]|nr:YihY/virulence factor BrkB family protein [Elusimicrobiota bacterium]
MKIPAKFREYLGLLKDSGMRMSEDQVPMMGAALAYYMMFSIAPLLVIAIGAAGIVFGKKAASEVFQSIQGLLGAKGAAAINSMVTSAAAKPNSGVIATVIGFVTLAAGASGVFSQLQQSLDIIWRVAAKPGATWRVMVRQRLFSLGMIAVIGLLLLVSLVVSAAISAAGTLGAGLPGAKIVWSAVNFIVSLAIISGLFAAVLKILPDVRLRWRDVAVGAVFTGVLFVIGKALIGAYIGRSGVSSSYGAAGSLIIVLLWVFYSSQILFFGAEFTRAWVTRGGRSPAPKEGATLIPSAFPAVGSNGTLVEKAPGHRRDHSKAGHARHRVGA